MISEYRKRRLLNRISKSERKLHALQGKWKPDLTEEVDRVARRSIDNGYSQALLDVQEWVLEQFEGETNGYQTKLLLDLSERIRQLSGNKPAISIKPMKVLK